MTEQTPPPYPAPAPLYAIRTHAEICWQDILGFIFGALSPVSILGLLFSLMGRDEAKKINLKQHALGTVGLIFSIIGCVVWTLFWFITWVAGASAHADVPPSFGSGTYAVGSDIPPGNYRSAGPDGSNLVGCYYARLKHNDGAFGDIIDNNISKGQSLMTVKPSDGYVEISGCSFARR